MKRFSRQRRESRNSHHPTLRFSPYTWAKLLHLRDAGPTEVGGFGISAEGDPLLVADVRLVRQTCTATTVTFDDAAVADHFDDGVDAGLPPERFARIWLHTHPGDSPEPSGTDERTFARVFGGCDWAVMAILARGGATYARLRFSAGPGGELVIPVDVDFSIPFAAADPTGWAEEYAWCVQNLHASARKRRTHGATDGDLAGALTEVAGEAFPSRFDPFDVPISGPEVWEFHDEHHFHAAAGED